MEKQTTPKEENATQVQRRAITGEMGYGSPVEEANVPDNTFNLVDDDEKAGARGDVATE